MTRNRVAQSVQVSLVAGALVAGAFGANRLAAQSAPQGTPTFRAGVDLIAVDVQVVDKTGRPIGALKPSDFEVEIAGRRRRVVSADYIESADPNEFARLSDRRPVQARFDESARPGAGRTYVLAFDTDSFTIEESRDVVLAARQFIRQLNPDDLVGLYTFPVGPRHEPTIEHASVSLQVDQIVGRSQQMIGEFNLSPSEIIDITAEASHDLAKSLDQSNPSTAISATATPNGTPTSNGADTSSQPIIATSTLQRVQLRECGAVESSCADSIRAEANEKAFYLEGRATEGLNGLRSLIQLLGEQPGRKTVVMFSTGIPATDRPGGRPDPGDVAKLLGQDAAATNTTIYTLLVNTRGFLSEASENRANDPVPTSLSRDNVVSGRLLEEFSGASGGALLRVLLGGGDVALARVLRETSSHYLLGVEPANVDRDGKLKTLHVKVDHSGVTIRSRSWVMVPKKTA